MTSWAPSLRQGKRASQRQRALGRQGAGRWLLAAPSAFCLGPAGALDLADPGGAAWLADLRYPEP